MFLNSRNPKKFRFTLKRPITKRKSANAAKVAAGIFIFVGLIFLSIATFMTYYSQQFAKSSVQTEMSVLQVDRKRSDNGFVYQPTFQARSPDGVMVEYVSTFWVSPKPHSQGDIVTGRANWETGVLRSDRMMKSTRLLRAIFGGIGLTTFVLGVCIAVFLRRKSKRTYP